MPCRRLLPPPHCRLGGPDTARGCQTLPPVPGTLAPAFLPTAWLRVGTQGACVVQGVQRQPQDEGGAQCGAGHGEHLAPRSSFAVTHPGNPCSTWAGCPGPLLPWCKAIQEQRINTISPGCLPLHLSAPSALALQRDQEVAWGTVAPAMGSLGLPCPAVPLSTATHTLLAPKQPLFSTRAGVAGAIGCRIRREGKWFGVR